MSARCFKRYACCSASRLTTPSCVQSWSSALTLRPWRPRFFRKPDWIQLLSGPLALATQFHHMSSTKSPSSYQDAFPRHGFQQGLPLWNPAQVSLPRNRQNEGLKIGDVGIIDRDGYFVSIFNICNPPDLALEHKYGFPSKFSRIGEPNVIDYNSFPPGHVFSSPETSWSYNSSDVSHYTDPSTMSIR